MGYTLITQVILQTTFDPWTTGNMMHWYAQFDKTNFVQFSHVSVIKDEGGNVLHSSIKQGFQGWCSSELVNEDSKELLKKCCQKWMTTFFIIMWYLPMILMHFSKSEAVKYCLDEFYQEFSTKIIRRTTWLKLFCKTSGIYFLHANQTDPQMVITRKYSVLFFFISENAVTQFRPSLMRLQLGNSIDKDRKGVILVAYAQEFPSRFYFSRDCKTYSTVAKIYVFWVYLKKFCESYIFDCLLILRESKIQRQQKDINWRKIIWFLKVYRMYSQKTSWN